MAKMRDGNGIGMSTKTSIKERDVSFWVMALWVSAFRV